MPNNPAFVFDIDNTLFDWVDIIVPAIRAMTLKASELTGVDENKIISSLRDEHRKRHSVEHPYSLADTTAMKEHWPERSFREIKKALAPAFEAFDLERSRRMRPYPKTIETLKILRRNYKLIAYTESNIISTSFRNKKLSLDKYIDVFYCSSVSTINDSISDYRHVQPHLDSDMYKLVPPNKRKPSPEILSDIERDEGVRILAYIGDSLFKDIKMAQDAKIPAIWAKYGTVHKPENSELLIRISHWTESEIEEFKRQSSEPPPVPDYTLESSIDELVPIIGDPSFS